MPDSPKRIQMSRQHPWRADNPDAVVVSRGSSYGNPFPVGGWYVEHEDGLPYPTVFPNQHPDARRIPLAETAVALYRRHVAARPDFREKVRNVLAGRDLACWCKLDEPCHADLLLEIANAGDDSNE